MDEVAINPNGSISGSFALITAISIIGALITTLGVILYRQVAFQFMGLRTDLKGMADLVKIHDREIVGIKKDIEHLQDKND